MFDEESVGDLMFGGKWSGGLIDSFRLGGRCMN